MNNEIVIVDEEFCIKLPDVGEHVVLLAIDGYQYGGVYVGDGGFRMDLDGTVVYRDVFLGYYRDPKRGASCILKQKNN